MQERIDPYSFAPTIGARDLTAFSGGFEARAWQFLGAHACVWMAVDGVRFAVWAPNAERVSVVGPFCDWDGRRLPMRVAGRRAACGNCSFPASAPARCTNSKSATAHNGAVVLKTDPYGRATELRPGTASIVCDSHYGWSDGEWMQRAARARLAARADEHLRSARRLLAASTATAASTTTASWPPS